MLMEVTRPETWRFQYYQGLKMIEVDNDRYQPSLPLGIISAVALFLIGLFAVVGITIDALAGTLAATIATLSQELDVSDVDVQAVLSVVRYGLNGDTGGFICLNYCR